MLAYVGALRDRVLDNAELEGGETVLDVGCGDGLIAFGALERGAGQVVFADISKPLLDDCRELATEAGVLERCWFVEAPAEKLAPIDHVTATNTHFLLKAYKEDGDILIEETPADDRLAVAP